MVVRERYDFPMILFLLLLYYPIMRARTHRRNHKRSGYQNRFVYLEEKGEINKHLVVHVPVGID